MILSEVFDRLYEIGQQNREKSGTDDLRVMSNNVLNTKDPASLQSPISFEERATILGSYYLYFAPDLLGLQEISQEMLAILMSCIGEQYAVVDTSGEDNNYTPV